MNRGVHIVTTGFTPRDAISQHVIEEQTFIRSLGLRCEIFAEPKMTHPAYRDRARDVREWSRLAQSDDAAILHYSIASPAIDHVLDRAARCGLVYHNITPAEMLRDYAPALARECEQGRRRLAELADRVVATVADSAYNANELIALGFPEPRIGGILLPSLTTTSPIVRASGGRTRLLFVGRGVPNKAQHDLILALAALREVAVDAELLLVGGWGGLEAYHRHCQWLARAAGVADRVTFAGSIDDTELAEAYASSDLFLCLSDHEGFCVPLVEAMAADLPIVAFASSATPGTVGQAGLVLDQKTPSLVAEAVMETLANPELRDWMAAGRQERLAFHHPDQVRSRLHPFVENLA